MRALLGFVLAIVGCTFAEPADIDALDGAGLSVSAGNDQAGTVGTTLDQPIVIAAADQDGNPIANLTLELTVVAGGGSVASPAITTDVQGNATTQFTLGTTPGINTLQARILGAEDAVSASATAIVGNPSKVEIASGNAQSGAAGTSLPEPLVVRVIDQYSNPVPDIPVEFLVVEGDGSTADVTATTDNNGLASTSLVLDTKAGANSVFAVVLDLEPATFTASGLAGAAAQLRKTAGEGQSAAGGTLLATPLEVTVEDVHGNPVAGVPVQFTADRGTVTTSSALTDSSGVASTTFRLSSSTGLNRITAEVDGIPPVEFLASTISATATSITKVSGDNQTGTVNRTLTSQLVVIARDQSANPVEGFLVTFVTTTNNGAPITATVATDVNGQARTSFRLGTVAGTNTIQPRGGAVIGASFTATGTADVPTKVIVPSTPTFVDAFASPTTLSAITTDAFNNPVSGRTVTWVVTSGNATINPTSGVSNPVVSTALTVNNLEDVTLEARSTGLTTATVPVNVHGFRPPTDVSSTIQGTSVRTADLNGDSKPDIVVFAGSASTTQGLEMFANTTPASSSVATVGPLATALSNSTVNAVVFGDFNADQKQDIAVQRRNFAVPACTTSCLTLLINTTVQGSANLTFTTVDLSTPNVVPRSLGVGDINLDGKLDLITTANPGFSVWQFAVLFGAGNGTFSAPALSGPVGFMDSIPAVVDLNLDGAVDVISSGTGEAYHRNTTTFASTTPTFVSSSMPFVLAADLDNDQKPDIFGVNNGTSTIGRNTTVQGAADPTFVFTNVSLGAVGAAVGHFGVGTPDAFPDLFIPTGASIGVAKSRMAQGFAQGFTNPKSMRVGVHSVLKMTTEHLDGDLKSDVITIRQRTAATNSPPFTLAIMLGE